MTEQCKRLVYIITHSNGFTFGEIQEILQIVPELKPCVGCTQNHPAHYLDVFNHILNVVGGVDTEPTLRVAALLHDIGKPSVKTLGEDGFEHFWGHEEASYKMVKPILKRLEFSSKDKNSIETLVKFHDCKFNMNITLDKAIKQVEDSIGKELMNSLFEIKYADLMAHSDWQINRIKPLLDTVFNYWEGMNKN